ncbi:MAG: aminoglycoside phosphotransferase family protein [Gammaproteobacteria bacterium]|nr:aminoglycoside phosphotransferase family protein [Gammaproteobacteria bacterium]
MRAPSRTPLPDLALLLEETNLLLATNGLPTCHALAPVSDGDTANPVVVAHSSERKYVVKVTERHAETLDHQLEVANALRDATDLPIPQHYCCARKGDRLPLMIMEWLPGEQLRTVLATAHDQDLKTLCASLATCLANFHDPVHLAAVPDTGGGFAEWLYARSMGVLEQTGAPGPGRDELDAAAIRRYIDARLPALAVTAIPSLVKADQDLRDFLADPEEYQITGMLDWERVTRGDGIFAITLIYLRLWLNGKLDGWADFYATYNRRANKQAEQCRQAEFYLMCRAVLAYEFNDAVARLVDQLLEGKRLPFEGA